MLNSWHQEEGQAGISCPAAVPPPTHAGTTPECGSIKGLVFEPQRDGSWSAAVSCRKPPWPGCRSPSSRTHVISDLPPKVVAAAMGHSVQTHLAAYSRWCADDVVDVAFAKAEPRLGQG
jgi:hypothetical protein